MAEIAVVILILGGAVGGYVLYERLAPASPPATGIRSNPETPQGILEKQAKAGSGIGTVPRSKFTGGQFITVWRAQSDPAFVAKVNIKARSVGLTSAGGGDYIVTGMVEQNAKWRELFRRLNAAGITTFD